jgi:hypothetical protein
LNINTIGSDFLELDAQPTHKSPLLFIDGSKPWDAKFWHRLIEFRDLSTAATSWFPGTRDVQAVGVALANYPNHLGLEQLGELCLLQLAADPNFLGFWQDRASLGNLPGLPWSGINDAPPLSNGIPDFLLPAQHARRFARNANLLTTRSDTYMVTVRVEIVRQTPNLAVLGQREYMYLVDRSYCLRAPQQGAPTAPLFNGRVNPTFVPPKVWRMTIPRYAAYGG